ncbi:MAG: hypothetical protein RL701_5402 [Pseudomonadota bacterium]|jgi:hypothetical protein
MLLYGTMDHAPPISEVVALLDGLARLESRLARIEQHIERVAELERAAPALFAAATDSFDDAARALAQDGIDLEERKRAGLALLERLTRPATFAVLDKLFDELPVIESWLDTRNVGSGVGEMLSCAGEALRAAQNEQASVGVLGLLRALSEAGVQRSLGFAVSFARQFGRRASQRLPVSGRST